MRLGVCAAALMVLAGGSAWAHPEQGGSGFVHPFTGIDHLLAMVAVGVWAWLLSARKPAAAFLVPVAFLMMMALGATAGFAGIALPLAEAIILASVFALGALVLSAVRLPMAAAMTLVGLLAVFHGHAHAIEAPTQGPGAYVLAFLATTAFLHAAGLALGWSAHRLLGTLGLRALGGVVLAGGAFVLVAQ